MSRLALGVSFLFVAATSALLGVLAGGGGALSGGPPSFADVVPKVNPGVVHITVTESAAHNVHAGVRGAPSVEVPRRGEGSGFIVDARGYVLTNHHLVSSPGRIRVRLTDKRELLATVVGTDPSTDLALLKVDAAGLPVVPMGDSDRLRVGEWVCAIGNPYHYEHSVTVGVVSSKGRKIWDASFDAYIQTDAAINPGNSGGPLINAAGEAVGINAAVSTEGQGIGFAIPINMAREILEQLKTRGHVSRGYLGVQLHELDPDLQNLLGVPDPRGAVVLDVLKGSAGEKAGLRRYDVITEVSGQGVEDGDRLVHNISATAPGTAVTLSVRRDGRPLTLTARLTERGPEEGRTDDDENDVQPAAEPGDRLGLVMSDLSPKARADLKVPADKVGVLVKDVVGASPGADVIDHGDLVVEVNRRPTPDLAAYRKVVASLPHGGTAWLYLYRPRPATSLLTKVDVEEK